MFAKSQQAIAISNVWIAFGLACVGWQALAINPIECRFVGQIKEFACLLEKPKHLQTCGWRFALPNFYEGFGICGKRQTRGPGIIYICLVADKPIVDRQLCFVPS